MEREQYISLFLRFLKEENVHRSFVELWGKAKGKKYKTIQEWLMVINPINFVYCAFQWQELFWCKIHDKWVEICKQIQ